MTKPNLPLATTPNYHLLNAMFTWITENEGRPYIVVPLEHVPANLARLGKDGNITLNISLAATGGLTIEREFVSFTARFGGVKTELNIPTDQILHIYNADAPSMFMSLPQWGTVEAEPTPAAPKRPALSVVK